MNSKVSLIVRIVFGLFLIAMGANKFFHFMPPPSSLSPEAVAYWKGLVTTHTMTLVAIVEIAAGLSLLLKKYVGLTMLVLLSVSINAVLFHVAFDISEIGPAIILLVLNLLVIFVHKNEYKGLLA
ncbi:MAG: DoxX family membrane protein [Flavobacteriaceae bacterium]